MAGPHPLDNDSLDTIPSCSALNGHIVLNELSLWSSVPRGQKKGAAAHLPEIRIRNAVALVSKVSISKGAGSGSGNGTRVPGGY